MIERYHRAPTIQAYERVIFVIIFAHLQINSATVEFVSKMWFTRHAIWLQRGAGRDGGGCLRFLDDAELVALGSAMTK